MWEGRSGSRSSVAEFIAISVYHTAQQMGLSRHGLQADTSSDFHCLQGSTTIHGPLLSLLFMTSFQQLFHSRPTALNNPELHHHAHLLPAHLLPGTCAWDHASGLTAGFTSSKISFRVLQWCHPGPFISTPHPLSCHILRPVDISSPSCGLLDGCDPICSEPLPDRPQLSESGTGWGFVNICTNHSLHHLKSPEALTPQTLYLANSSHLPGF